MSHLQTALTNMRRAPYQSLAAVLILSITLFVCYTFSLIMVGAELILGYFETRPQVIAYFAVNTTSDKIATAQKAMESKSYVESVRLVSQEDALEIFQETNKEDPILVELVTADILPPSIEVSATNPDSLTQIKSDLEQLDGVNDVQFQENVVDRLRTITKALRVIGVVAATILGTTSFLTIMVLTSLKIRLQRSAVNIMRMIGATKWYIKAPFLFEGALYGVLGSLIGWGMMYVALLYLTPWLKDFLGPINLLPVNWLILVAQLAAGTLATMLLTTWAAYTAVGRIIKK